jgi:hypothetical protein
MPGMSVVQRWGDALGDRGLTTLTVSALGSAAWQPSETTCAASASRSGSGCTPAKSSNATATSAASPCYRGSGDGGGRVRETLTSRTVRDRVVGSDLALDDHGMHPLKGVEGGWQLVTVTRP